MTTSYKNGACAIVLAAAMASTGCGTMFGGSRQLIQAASIPEGATVAAGGTAGSRTPTSLSLERKNNYVLEFSAPGYTTQHALSARLVTNLAQMSRPSGPRAGAMSATSASRRPVGRTIY